MDLEAFHSYSEQERRWLTGATFDQEKIRFLDSGKPNAPYFMPFQACVAWGVMLAADESEVAHFVFDEQNEFSGYALQRLKTIRSHMEKKGMARSMGDAVFASSKNVAALQAADLVAFLIREKYKSIRGHPSNIPENAAVWGPSYVLERIISNRPYKIIPIGKATMDHVVETPKRLCNFEEWPS